MQCLICNKDIEQWEETRQQCQECMDAIYVDKQFMKQVLRCNKRDEVTPGWSD